ncbi:MAG: Rieske 2Fe-2S domain-containing protein [Desulfobulbaceae bacterium]|nr:Rieske 2Fe-2S domain-containing protein [Desulfobulbaceae bacterium]
MLRFTNYTVQPKPRFITVPAPLPISGYYSERDFILFVIGSIPLAVSRKCTHLGCRVSYLEDKQIIECPCHQSRFTREGKLITGPAKKNLPTFPVEIKKDPEGKVTGYVVTL